VYYTIYIISILIENINSSKVTTLYDLRFLSIVKLLILIQKCCSDIDFCWSEIIWHGYK